MHDYFTNQAAGLLGLTSKPGPRLLAVVSHGDDQAELPLLWQLCLSLVNFGYPVTVLDATTYESDSNPGLEQLMDHSHWIDDHDQAAPAWTVMPSGHGLQNLCAAPISPGKDLQRLGHLFAADSVVVLYCKVEWMIPLVGNGRTEPLIAVSPSKASLLNSYIALKRLLITGNLKPTIVNMVQDTDFANNTAVRPASTGLSECAKKFLGRDIKTLNITEKSGDLPLQGDIQHLALRLLESSMELRAEYQAVASFATGAHMDHIEQQGEMH